MTPPKVRRPLPTGLSMEQFISGAGQGAPAVVLGEKANVVADVIAVPQPVADEIEAIVKEVNALVETPVAAPVQAPPRAPSPKKAAPTPKPDKQTLPWEDANPKIKSFVQVRAPEPLALKLKWIKENSLGVNSVHDLILNTLEEMADKRIKAILKGRAGQSDQE